MGSSSPHTPPPEPERTGLEEESISAAQEAVPVPFLAGTRKVAGRWLSGGYNQRTEEAPAERPTGKK